MNITEETDGYAALMKAAEKMNDEKEVKPQTCSLDDDECLNCGS